MLDLLMMETGLQNVKYLFTEELLRRVAIIESRSEIEEESDVLKDQG